MTPRARQSQECEAIVAEDHEPIPARPRPAITSKQVLRPIQTLRYRWYPVVKNVLERCIALALAIPATPIMLIAAALIKLTSRGPAFYTQVRIGVDGERFVIYKLRTMINNCESLTGPRWSLPGDPRITAVGQFLRWSHVDELPQLFNVLLGDMSLIGPRPERPEFLPELESAFPGYSLRHAVRPGVTGLAQVQVPADSDLNGVQYKLSYDLYYVQNLSPWLDLRILFCTLLYVCGTPFRTLTRFLRIPQREAIRRKMKPFVSAGQMNPPLGRAA